MTDVQATGERLPSRMKYSCTLGIAVLLGTTAAHAVSSAELYTEAAYSYGRFEARLQYAPGGGVVSSFFLWKDGSEVADVFWNELDFEKIEAGCIFKTNALYGLPEANHSVAHDLPNLCTTFHTYAYEWTPEYVAWVVDGVEVRRETGEAAQAFANNTAQGMQIRFNVWPGDASFGGNFDPAILPVHQYVNWVQYSSYTNGSFQFEWREDFSGDSLPPGWLTATWGSPKNLSTHAAENVTVRDGYAIVSLTADDALGDTGAAPLDPDDDTPVGGAGGASSGGGGEPNQPDPNGGGTAGQDATGTGGTTAPSATSGAAGGTDATTGAGGNGTAPLVSAGANSTTPSGVPGDPMANPTGPGTSTTADGSGAGAPASTTVDNVTGAAPVMGSSVNPGVAATGSGASDGAAAGCHVTGPVGRRGAAWLSLGLSLIGLSWVRRRSKR